MAKNLEIALLFDFYGEMLTDKQRDVVELYYNDDLSLSEIAENEGITRQGVRDSIKRAETQLTEMEERLGLVRRFGEMREKLEEIRQGNMEDWELEGTRRTMIGAHLATLDVQDRQEDFWLGQTAAGLETGIEELVAQLEQVTREQVAQAAQKLELDTIYFLKGTEG